MPALVIAFRMVALDSWMQSHRHWCRCCPATAEPVTADGSESGHAEMAQGRIAWTEVDHKKLMGEDGPLDEMESRRLHRTAPKLLMSFQ